ncbi:YbaB/EbfC family nucleoid-associated protein [Mycoplasmopsis gallopavonis]|uniref:Nucleoid-associated protein NCTC10186_00421 n=1 Tax=Mycoplasmopsis gallopavonis TaxID=76629 RepID=A0A449AZM6_9BACT|nr:YbaB/EbfC family nucleoid-associated protein [Mycoplasmopsis gallopavonis]RIV16703.1 YbaB/EbfC family nucleoid-associated protein [Mycoplasmopsis gallopavonis]VEU72935.1 UPF0133 protein MALL_0399 [Mycoplasmopsis gallopavonis]
MNPAMLKKLQQMQKEMLDKQKALEAQEFVVEKQGIKVVVKGDMSVKSIEIDEVLVDPEDKELLEDLMVIALNEAFEQVKDKQAEMTPQMPSGFGF